MKRALLSFSLAAALILAIGAGSVQATVHTINVDNFFFSPTKTMVNPGDTVRWVFVAGTHSTTSDGSSAKAWDSGLKTSGIFEVVFLATDSPAPFPYHCTAHPTMRDTIFWAPSADPDGDGWAAGVDCHNSDASVYPGAPEVPNDGIDQDCNGIDATLCYVDADGDGWGDHADPGTVELSGVCPVGKILVQGDCDDANASVHPGATEVCNGVDDDCNGTIDDNAVGGATWYFDADGDGYGVGSMTVVACSPPSGYASVGGDCNDANAAINPGASETCDGTDEDCDSFVDEDAIDGTTWYRDADGDSYGDPAVDSLACAQPTGYVANADDCDDTDPMTVPPCGCCLLRGDFNNDGIVAVSDLTALINFLFRGGPAPACLDHGDTNGDSTIAVSDLTLLINFLFRGGPPPAAC